MADDLRRRFATPLSPGGECIRRYMAVLFVALFSAHVTAENLPDPTRIPASISTPVATTGMDAQPTGLQTILISKTRRAAIIDGVTGELGGKHGDARLIEVNEGSVVLKGAQGRQVLTLFPGIKMIKNKEIGTRPQPVANKVQSGKQKSGPVAHEEKK